MVRCPRSHPLQGTDKCLRRSFRAARRNYHRFLTPALDRKHMVLRLIATFAILLAGTAIGWVILEFRPPTQAETAEEGKGKAASEYERGPHRGRLLRSGNFAVEVTIFEEGVPPEFHVYAYQTGKPLPPTEVSLSIELTRLGGQIDRFEFEPRSDYLLGLSRVKEPHSFDVRVRATYAGQAHEWTYESYEGRTRIAAEAAETAGVKIEAAGPSTIREIVELTGTIAVIPDRIARVRGRFPGVVREVHKSLGDRVRAGEMLALIEGNESLRTYPVSAPIAGTVLARSTNVGDITSGGDNPLFVVADLSSVWAELHAFGRDHRRLAAGQPVTVAGSDGEPSSTGIIGSFAPITAAASQSVPVRVALDNADGRWRPGMFVRASVTIAERRVPLAVKASGLQRFRDFTVVFARVGDEYEVRMLELGVSDGTWVEILDGLSPGEHYVSENSFLIKADVEKPGASHDH